MDSETRPRAGRGSEPRGGDEARPSEESRWMISVEGPPARSAVTQMRNSGEDEEIAAGLRRRGVGRGLIRAGARRHRLRGNPAPTWTAKSRRRAHARRGCRRDPRAEALGFHLTSVVRGGGGSLRATRHGAPRAVRVAAAAPATGPPACRRRVSPPRRPGASAASKGKPSTATGGLERDRPSFAARGEGAAPRARGRRPPAPPPQRHGQSARPPSCLPALAAAFLAASRA